MPPRKFSSVHSIQIKDSVCRPCASPTGFNTHLYFCYSLLPQPDRILRTQVKTVHQPIGALQTNRTNLNSSTLKQLAPIWSPQLLRMSAIVLDLVSKGRLSAFGRVSFVTFLWRNKEKFIKFIFNITPWCAAVRQHSSRVSARRRWQGWRRGRRDANRSLNYPSPCRGAPR